jgi:hypothetical protein
VSFGIRSSSAIVALILTHIAPAVGYSQQLLRLTQDLTLAPEDARGFPSRLISDSRGNSYVYYAVPDQIWQFNAKGKPLSLVAQAGQGPRDLQGVAYMGLYRDSLWVACEAPRSIRFLSGPQAAMLRSARISAAGDTPLDPIGVFSDGSLLHVQRPETDGYPTSETSVAWRLDRAGRIAIKLTELTNALPLTEPHRDHIAYDWDPFTGTMEIVLDPTGRFLYRVDGRAPANENAGAIVIDRLDFNGKVIWTRRYPFTPQRIPAKLLDELTRSWSNAKKAVFNRRGHFVPAATSVIAGTDGTLFLSRDLEKHTWDMVGTDGAPIGRIAIEEGSALLGGEHDHVWIARESDRFAVVRYRISER